MGKQAVRISTAAYTYSGAPTRNYGGASTINAGAGSSDPNGAVGNEALVYVARPFPLGATLISARLMLYSVDNLPAASRTLTVTRLNGKWSASKVTFKNRPTANWPGNATLTRTDAVPPGRVWDIDVTSLMQQVASGGGWDGFRIRANSKVRFHSESATVAGVRPVLVVEWSDQPSTPSRLAPSGGRAVSKAKPVLRCDFTDVLGDVRCAGINVRLFNTEAGALANNNVLWDSGDVATSDPELDLNGTTAPAVAIGADMWWRVRVKDGAGLWSGWSVPAQFTYRPLGALALLSPTADGDIGNAPAATPVTIQFTIGYGNIYGGYSDSDTKGNAAPYSQRVQAQADRINALGVDLFFPVECHEQDDQHEKLLARMKLGNSGWKLHEGRGGNQGYYKGPFTILDEKTFAMPGKRDMTDFLVRHNPTGLQFNVINAHFIANGSSGDQTENRKKQAAYVAEYAKRHPICIIVGDFNSATSTAGYPMDIFAKAGFANLPVRSNPANADKNSYDGAAGGQWIEGILTRTSTPVIQSAGVPTGKLPISDHALWMTATIAVTTNTAPDGKVTGYDTVVNDVTPPVAWSAPAQQSFDVRVLDLAGKQLWGSGRITDAATQSMTIPAGVITRENTVYQLAVRVWDAYAREQITGANAYSSVSLKFIYDYDPIVEPPTAVIAVQRGVTPTVDLVWNRGEAPDGWIISRGNTVLARVDYDDVLQEDGSFRWSDPGPAPTLLHTYAVQAVVNGVASTKTIDAITTQVQGIWLIELQSEIAPVVIWGQSADMEMGEDSAWHAPYQGDRKVLITQSQRGFEGTVDGDLTANEALGLTVQQVMSRFMGFRDRSGRTVRLVFSSGFALDVVISKVKMTPNPGEELTAGVGFEFAEQNPQYRMTV